MTTEPKIILTTETKIVLKVTHEKPLPKDAAKVIEQRFYMWAYSQGVEVGVKAEVESEISLGSQEVERG